MHYRAATLYRRPKYLGICISSNMDEALLAELREECKITNEVNQETHKSLKAKHDAMVAYAVDLYGNGSNEVKYLKQRPAAHPPTYYFSDFERKIEELKREEARRHREEEAARKERELLEKSIPYLLERGNVLGVDFTLENAVMVANSVAYDEEVERRKKEIEESGELIEFNGMNCNDSDARGCNGWDGEARRCECGNRRVYWAKGWGHTFLDPYVYADAY